MILIIKNADKFIEKKIRELITVLVKKLVDKKNFVS